MNFNENVPINRDFHQNIFTRIGKQLCKNLPEHGTRECAVNLLQRSFSRVVDVNNGHMSQEPVAKGFPAGICRWITCTDKLNSFQRDPCLIARPVEAPVFHQLSQEGNHTLRPVVIHVGQIDFVAEQDQPLAQLYRGKYNAVRCFAIFAVVIERFKQ